MSPPINFSEPPFTFDVPVWYSSCMMQASYIPSPTGKYSAYKTTTHTSGRCLSYYYALHFIGHCLATNNYHGRGDHNADQCYKIMSQHTNTLLWPFLSYSNLIINREKSPSLVHCPQAHSQLFIVAYWKVGNIE